MSGSPAEPMIESDMPGALTLTAAEAAAALRKFANPAKVAAYRNFVKNSREDIFLGVTTPLMRRVAKEFRGLPLREVRTLIRSQVHDERALAYGILVLKFAKAVEADQARIYEFYLKNRSSMRDWDEVDGSAPYIVGPYLMHRDKAVLYELAVSKNLWDRRIALVATLPMIRKGLIADTLKLVEMVLGDKEDLIHKAGGWMLREVGKRDETALKNFLSRHHTRMPRTMFRYAIERFPQKERLRYLHLGSKSDDTH